MSKAKRIKKGPIFWTYEHPDFPDWIHEVWEIGERAVILTTGPQPPDEEIQRGIEIVRSVVPTRLSIALAPNVRMSFEDWTGIEGGMPPRDES